MPLPDVVLIQPDELSLGLTALTDYNNMQRAGATDDSIPAAADRVDNIIVADTRVQQNGQSNTPLFLPLDKLDSQLSEANRAESGMTESQAVYKQMSDNGVLPLFLATVRLFVNKLISDKWLCTTRVVYGLTSPSGGSSSFSLSGAGLYPHSSGAGVTGVPVDGDTNANYVEILNPATNAPLVVLAGPDTGKRVYGVTRVGGSTSPNSVEVGLFAKNIGDDPATSPNSYSWEGGQPATINVYYGYRQSLYNMDDTAFRRTFR